MTLMIVEYIRYQIPADRRGEFEAAYARAADVLRQAPQCVEYELTRCTEEPPSYVLRIVWTSESDHLEGFRRSARFGDFLAAIKAYVPDIQDALPLAPEDRPSTPSMPTSRKESLPTPWISPLLR